MDPAPAADSTAEAPERVRKPVLLTVDDDPGVSRAVERDLRREYARDYRVLRAESGDAALDLVTRLRSRGDDLALMLVDQRMPGMSGVDFMERARATFPRAKRVLLTAYADTEAAIKAINDVDLDHYLLKPWDPPEEQLYPVVSDLLEDWQANRPPPPYGGVRVVGHRFNRQSHELRDFLGRNQVPYRWVDVEEDEEARRLVQISSLFGGSNGRKGQLPLVVFPDGAALNAPTSLEVAEKLPQIRTRAELPFYDMIIVGGGPAGLAAAVYGASEGLRTLMIEREAPGGQAGTSSRIENYLGFPRGLSGADLTRRADTQARRFGAEVLTVQEVAGIEARGGSRVVRLGDGTELAAHTVVIATGVSYRRLDAPGVERLVGAGVYYGATLTEAAACENQEVYIIGAANSAGQGAMYFSKFASSVTMLIRGDSLDKNMSSYLVDQIRATPNIHVRPRSEVVEAEGEASLEAIRVRDTGSGDEERLRTTQLFIFIGAVPRTDWVGNSVARDRRGFVLAGPDLARDGKRPEGWSLERDPFLLETSVPGVFVAGDVRHESIKRVASAVGEGAMAVQFVHNYLGGPAGP